MTLDTVPGDPSCSSVRNRTRMSVGKAEAGNAGTRTTVRPPARNKLLFRLYVSPGEGASERALANLRAICREHFVRGYEIEVVDARKYPRRAERDGVIETPTLIKRSPAPAWTIVGDLSEDALILAAMKRK